MSKDKSNYSGFDGGTATYNVEGNMMSLIYGDVFEGETTLTGTYNFCSIFKQSKAVSAENMILPATTLTNYCYRAMFSLAPNLITPPALSATTLAQGCYWYMFEKCPMSTAPDLPASTLVQECYGNMFTGCSNLNYIKCMATTGFGTTNCLQTWVKGVAATGTFVKDANTSWSTGNNGIPTGWVVYDGEIVEDPVINFNGENKIEISCETSGATIYYRLGTSGSYTEYTGPITITGLTYNADVKILATNGAVVAEGRSNGGIYIWDGCNKSGNRVASGVYMVATATKDGNKGTVCKIAIIR